MRTTLAAAFCVAVVLGAGCARPAAPAATTTLSPTPAAASPTTTATPASTAAGSAASPILRAELTDVRTGSRFTLGGFAGKTVLVLGMAVW